MDELEPVESGPEESDSGTVEDQGVVSVELAPEDAAAVEAAVDPAASAETVGEQAADTDPGAAEAVEESPTQEPEAAEAGPSVDETDGSVSMDEFLAEAESAPLPVEDAQLRAVIEAIVYVAEEPLTAAQLSAALHQPIEKIRELIGQVVAEFEKPEHGVTVREVAGGYKMATKAEHHEAVRAFVKSLKPPLKLSLPALETLAVIAYKQPVTSPEIMEIRGVQGAGVLKTLLDRKLIAVAGRKNVIGKPMLYKTTKEFLIQFGLKDLAELPSLKEFEEIRRMAFSEEPSVPAAPEPSGEVAPGDPEAALSDAALPEEGQP